MPMNDVNWKELETRGFVHIRRFLSQHDLDSCRADYADQPVDEANRNNAVSGASERATARLEQPVNELMALVKANTDIRVDCNLGAFYFATTRGVFPWHQDYESYFVSQNHYNYLNLFIPVMKPRPDKSNLCLVPFDVLKRESPGTFQRVVGKGATMAFDLPDRQILFQADLGVAHVTRVPLDRLAFTPQLEAGDLLLLRGDILHRTEDGDTERVALSMRLGYSKTVVRRAKLADGGLAKLRTMSGNFRMYEPLFCAFDRAGCDELSWGELERLIKEDTASGRATSETPRSFLLRQKVRSGVVLSSVGKALTELVGNRALWMYHRRQARKTAARDAQPVQRTA
jgi:hypothetical protein